MQIVIVKKTKVLKFFKRKKMYECIQIKIWKFKFPTSEQCFLLGKICYLNGKWFHSLFLTEVISRTDSTSI